MQFIKRFVKDEDGATIIEYALLAALIAVALVASLQGVRGAIQGAFTRIVTALAAV